MIQDNYLRQAVTRQAGAMTGRSSKSYVHSGVERDKGFLGKTSVQRTVPTVGTVEP